MMMSVAQIKEAIRANLDKMDEGLLKAIHALTETYLAEQHSCKQEAAALEAEINAIPPYIPEESMDLIAEIEEANAEIERGEFITLEDLEKEMETW